METNSNSVRQKNSNAKKPFQTPQTASRANDHWTHQDSLFNDSLRRSLTKSADRYIPSRSAANTDFIRAVFDRKIQNAKAKSENAPFGNEDQNRQDIKIQNKLSLSPDLKKDRGTTAEVERSPSLENTSLSEKAEESGPNEASFASARGVGNEDSFNLSFLAAQRRVSKTGSPCGETSKSASKRVRSELNCDAFFGAKGRVDVWNDRVYYLRFIDKF